MINVVFIAALVAFMNICFWGYFAGGWKKRPISKETPSFSIIVAVHNEETNLQTLLPQLLAQKYPEYEVVVVLDRCTDGSKTVVSSFSAKNPHLRWFEITETPASISPKKHAIETGIKLSSYEYLAFTDADCVPDTGWLETLAQAYADETQIVLGLSPYQKTSGLLNKFIRYETFITALQYIGLAGQGSPYMGVGRNLSYKKSFFMSKGGFGGFRESLSGDDDLFVNAHATRENISYSLNQNNKIPSEPKHTLKEWIIQKTRHISASNQYSVKSKLILAGFSLSQVSSILLIFLLITNAKLCFWGGCIYVIRWFFCIILLRFPLSIWKEPDLIVFFPVMDTFLGLYYLLIAPLGLLMKPRWK